MPITQLLVVVRLRLSSSKTYAAKGAILITAHNRTLFSILSVAGEKRRCSFRKNGFFFLDLRSTPYNTTCSDFYEPRTEITTNLGPECFKIVTEINSRFSMSFLMCLFSIYRKNYYYRTVYIFYSVDRTHSESSLFL